MGTKTVDWLKRMGAPQEVIQEAEQETMMQADYTRKRQEERGQVSQLREQLARLEGRMQTVQDPSSGMRPTERFLARLKSDEKLAGTSDLFEEMIGAVRSELSQDYQQRMAPVMQVAAQSQIERSLEEYYKKRLEPSFGPGVREHFDAIREQLASTLAAGQSVSPEHVLWTERQSEMSGLMQKRAEQEARSQRARHTEGFTQSRDGRAPGDSGPWAGRAEHAPLNAAPALDSSQAVAEILDELTEAGKL